MQQSSSPYAPLLPRYLNFPEVLGLRAPLPTLVQNDTDDNLCTLTGMKQANKMLADMYAKANAAQKYEGKFYPGPHQFDDEMQRNGFDGFDGFERCSHRVAIILGQNRGWQEQDLFTLAKERDAFDQCYS